MSDEPGYTVPIEVLADEWGAARIAWLQDAAFRIRAESQDSERRLLTAGWKQITAGQAALELTLKLSDSKH